MLRHSCPSIWPEKSKQPKQQMDVLEWIKSCIQHAHTIRWQMKYVTRHAQPILASIKQLAMTRSSIDEYIDLGAK